MRRKGLRFPNGIPRAVTTDDLRHRIAYAIAQADGDAPGMKPASCDYEMADAVIEALGLEVTVTARSSDGSFRSFSIEGYWEERVSPND